jgi:hypothetical protein
MSTRQVRRMGLAAAAGLLAITVAPATVSHAAPAADVHYKVEKSTFCGSSPSCYPGGNVNIFPSLPDDSVARIGLPWPVYVYGTAYTSVWVSSNGNLQLGVTAGTAQGTYLNAALPSAGLSAKVGVALFWDDLNEFPTATPPQGVFYRSVNFGGQPAFVVSWRAQQFQDIGYPYVRAEVIFYEHSRNITFQYLETGNQNGASATIGIQKSPSGPASQWSYNRSNAVVTDEELTFVPVG